MSQTIFWPSVPKLSQDGPMRKTGSKNKAISIDILRQRILPGGVLYVNEAVVTIFISYHTPKQAK
jgi:hypothetical protein